jgi:hypothetical protein
MDWRRKWSRGSCQCIKSRVIVYCDSKTDSYEAYYFYLLPSVEGPERTQWEPHHCYLEMSWPRYGQKAALGEGHADKEKVPLQH